jgi:hypothetical protein
LETKLKALTNSAPIKITHTFFLIGDAGNADDERVKRIKCAQENLFS